VSNNQEFTVENSITITKTNTVTPATDVDILVIIAQEHVDLWVHFIVAGFWGVKEVEGPKGEIKLPNFATIVCERTCCDDSSDSPTPIPSDPLPPIALPPRPGNNTQPTTGLVPPPQW
jgi:hypothetical protein